MTEINHAARAHARLSPSGAKRWMACPGSVRLSEKVASTTTKFANEGTAAHELAELCWTMKDKPSLFLGRVIDISPESDVRLCEPGAKPNGDTRFEVTAEMAEAVGIYVEYVNWFAANGYECDTETRVSMEDYVAGMTGTADFLAYNEAIGHLFVVDLKYGAGVVVEPKENEQLMCYAIGALKRYGNRPVSKVTLVIVQPRASHPAGPIRSWETTPERLIEHGLEMRVAASEVGYADKTPDEFLLLEYLTSGEHCGFCPAKGFCPKLRAESLAVAKSDFDPVAASAASPDEVADWLSRVDMVEKWCKGVREFANSEAQNGRMPTGFKFVEKRATRKWAADPALIATTLRMVAELDETQIFTAPELRSVAQVEKAIGKKQMGVLDGLVIKQSSGLVLAPDADPRPAAAFDAKADFGEVVIEE